MRCVLRVSIIMKAKASQVPLTIYADPDIWKNLTAIFSAASDQNTKNAGKSNIILLSLGNNAIIHRNTNIEEATEWQNSQ